jgi:hypothetical protein
VGGPHPRAGVAVPSLRRCRVTDGGNAQMSVKSGCADAWRCLTHRRAALKCLTPQLPGRRPQWRVMGGVAR